MSSLVIDCETGEATERPLTPEEIEAAEEAAAEAAAQAEAQAWTALRDTRDATLTATDWLMNPPSDLPGKHNSDINAHKQEWIAYRQALRDMPTTTTDPFNPQWPVPPPVPVRRHLPKKKQ